MNLPITTPEDAWIADAGSKITIRISRDTHRKLKQYQIGYNMATSRFNSFDRVVRHLLDIAENYLR